MKSITNVVKDEHDVYLRDLARRWNQSRSWVMRRIIDVTMRRGIEPFDIDSADINPTEGEGESGT